MNIQMVDLRGQYDKIKEEVNAGIQEVLDSTAFINGSKVREFSGHLADYCGVKHVIPCGNGTDALQIALMALGLQPGDEVIVPAFTYVATAEVIGLLGLTPVMVDVDYASFNVTVDNIRNALSSKTRAIVPVHLFGQSCDMEPILSFAAEHGLFVVEDNAQAIGAEYTFADGTRKKTGTMGHIGCTSFFPSKNLGCYGDGGALMTDDEELAGRIRMIANHGQRVKYHHDVLGCNSRLDTIQAAVLDVKLRHLDEYGKARHEAARYYSARLRNIPGIVVPEEMLYTTHVYHQYTLKVLNGKRDALKKYLEEAGIPAMIYYPLPLQKQEAFKSIARAAGTLDTAERLSCSVLSLPIHTELTPGQQDIVIERIKEFYK
ncbi:MULTISPECIES: DegT/DnrJ/EryC1/StrS family aminotransferase [Porphyromonadaceae]|uniref:Pleiotropic regulatory protein n=1 Tax=Sanguibacteroides justesenii TaxID=1547597 RepID=A0A0C3RK05_9PORP|nr:MULTISPECIES: DegT/DnrJ/EryC1/StrS family aminotransferase [Porphyromonadaceae]KIO46684.1 Pleiotropic regulatory protein [Sanguibacteroides justesenii]